MKNFRTKPAFMYLKKLAFERTGGSPAERKAARIISAEMKKLGLKVKQEKFPVETFSSGSASIEAVSPFRKKFKAWPMGYSSPTPVKGITAPVVYLNPLSAAKLKNRKGEIILTDDGINAKMYRALKDSGAKAVIRICAPGKEIYNKFIHGLPGKLGRIAGASIRYEDGLEILRRGATKIRLKSRTSTRRATSQNVVTQIKGTVHPDEVILVGAHYDSVPWSSGAMDNAAGSALAMALAAKFMKKPLARTLRFVWFGCEELGLVGSFEYVKKHARQLKNVKLMLNLDVGANLVGRTVAYITGTDKLATYVRITGKELGAFSSVIETVVPSDSTPFAEKGIQSLSLSRSGSPGEFIHTKGDSIEHCGPEAFAPIGACAVVLLERLGNSVEFPFEGGLSGKMQKSLGKFMENFGRKYRYRENS